MHEPYFNTDRIMGYTIIGNRGSGKSALAEVIGELHYAKGYLVFDTLDASDYEGCFWVVEDKRWYPSVFILPEYVDYKIPPPYDERITVMRDTDGLKKIFKAATAKKPYKVVVFVSSAYEDEHRLEVLARFYNELTVVNLQMNLDIFLIIREISHIAGSNISIYKNGALTKRALMKLLSICRHHRVGYVLDSQILKTIFKSIRLHSDRTIIKKSVVDMIPAELDWVLRDINAKQDRFKGTGSFRRIIKDYPFVSKLFPREGYFLRSDSDRLPKVMSTKLPMFHHKGGKDSFEKMTGIEFRRNGSLVKPVVKESKMEARYRARIVNSITGLKKEGKSMGDISRLLGFSTPGGLTRFLKSKSNQN